VLRVMRETEDVAARLQATTGPSEVMFVAPTAAE
jgi:hypothetical protein